MSENLVFSKIISERTALGIVFASSLSLYYDCIVVNIPSLHKKAGISLYGEMPAFLFIGPLLRYILSAPVAVNSRNEIPIRLVPEPAVSKLRRGQHPLRPGRGSGHPGIVERPHIF
jgi:hypothetical protein